MREEYLLKQKAWWFGKKAVWKRVTSCLMCGCGGPTSPFICSNCIRLEEQELDRIKYEN